MRSIASIASTTVGEAVRRRVLLVILLVGLLGLIIMPGLSVLSARAELTVLKGAMLFIIQSTSAVIAIVLTVYMIPNEIERRTIYTILSKPVQRWQFLLGKYLGAVLALALMMTLMTIVILGVFLVMKQDVAEAIEVAKAPALYFVQMSLLAAVATFFSTFVSPLVNFFLSGGTYLLGTFLATFLKTMEENSRSPMFAKYTAKIVNLVFPNFAMFNTQNPITNPTTQIGSESGYYLGAAAYGIFYVGILMVLSILVFDRREV
jgi:ABC-type transport system involved in multi-copper enzyme maturation permease subunit